MSNWFTKGIEVGGVSKQYRMRYGHSGRQTLYVVEGETGWSARFFPVQLDTGVHSEKSSSSFVLQNDICSGCEAATARSETPDLKAMPFRASYYVSAS